LVTVQSALLVQKRVFTHSEGSELGDCDGYEHTSMRVAVPRSAGFTQHWACVSLVRQFAPVHLLLLRDKRAANGSVVVGVTVQLLTVPGLIAAPVQLNCFVLPQV
jgi:hypothetical protein